MMASRAWVTSFLIVVSIWTAEIATAKAWDGPCGGLGPFYEGRGGLSVTAGSSFVSQRSYLLLGVGAGYYLLDGLELGLDLTFWVLNEPFAATFTPHLTYVLHFVPKVKPYVGTLFRRYIVTSDVDDFNGWGVTFGAYFLPSAGIILGLGAVYEHLFNCDEDLFSCDNVYPEFRLTFVL